jgi:hypothetical protein
MRRSDKTIALVLAICATVAIGAAVAAPAGATTHGNGFQLSKFKVEIKGTQTMVQQRTHAAANECDISDSSSGSEKVSFRSSAATPPASPRRRLPAKTTAAASRPNTNRIAGPGSCSRSRSGCSTRGRRRTLCCSPPTVARDPFERCSGGGYSMTFPNLLLERSGARGQYIYADLSQDELFDPEFQKWISIAEGSRNEQDADSWAKTNIHWEVSFTRLREKP